MEDELIISGRFRDREDEDVFAIFDGHGGPTASSFAAQHFMRILEEEMQKESDPKLSLASAFLTTHKEMRSLEPLRGGTTALVAFVKGDHFFVANAGDCRAVLHAGGQTMRCSTDQKPDDPEEEKRISELGGKITTNVDPSTGKVISRVSGQLSIARSLGDFSLEPFVTPYPEVKGPFEWNKQPSGFLILACDGLWDVLEDEEAVQLISSVTDAEEGAILLREEAYSRGSQDNISVLVVLFPPFG